MFKYTFEMTLGRLFARKTRFELEKYCAREGLEVSFMESKGWLETDYQVIIRGAASKWPKVQKELETWFKELQAT